MSDPAETNQRLRRLPSMDRLLRLQPETPAGLARAAASDLLAELRRQLLAGTEPALDETSLAAALARRRAVLSAPRHRRVVNGTGVLLHTGLGRAPLAGPAREALRRAAGAVLVEVDPASGRRSRREEACAHLLAALTGAESALVVNNNAGAVLLALAALAAGREVPVSRGELVEIGGGFRMPEVMAQAGCRLVEVGTTNRTRLEDYERAIGPETGALLKVHPSNYRIEGFTEIVPVAELAALAGRCGLPLIEDLGSGHLLREALPHDPREPSAPASVAAGADLVCFSGDKLLGGCQAGLIVGRRSHVESLRSHPLYRALRPGKLTLAALEATLLVHRFGEPKREIPVLAAIYAAAGDLEARAHRLAARLTPAAGRLGFAVEVVASTAYVGSGASPARGLESRAVALVPQEDGRSLEAFAARLRAGDPSIWGRIEDGRLLFDLRSLGPNDGDDLEAALALLAGA